MQMSLSNEVAHLKGAERDIQRNLKTNLKRDL